VGFVVNMKVVDL